MDQKFDTNEFGPQKSLLQILTYGNKDPLYGRDTLEIMALENLVEMISIDENIKTGVITLSVFAPEPKFAIKLNESFIKKLDEHQKKYNKAKTSETRQFIEERIIDAEKQLMNAEENLKVFRDRNRRIENSPNLLLEQQRLSRGSSGNDWCIYNFKTAVRDS